MFASLFTVVQPMRALQPSSVHAFPSLHTSGAPPTQRPPLHVSLVVQALPSSHASVLLPWMHPSAVSQVSVVQMFESLQLGAAPPMQVPPLHVSLVVHALPSLQGAVFAALTQPTTALQLSSVQGLVSLQSGGAPPTQPPALQVSAVVHAFPSSHGTVLLVCVQPVAGLQLSSVHVLESLQFLGKPDVHVPPVHVSPTVQALPSLQGTVLLVCRQPRAASQVSFVHTFESSQLGAAPPRQVPALQVSFVVHAFPSLHELVLLEWAHPVEALQLSSVQTLPSSQLGGAPPTQTPALQVSAVVHAFPSLHDAVLFVWVHAPEASQMSSVQGLPSSQFALLPWQPPWPRQAPETHASGSSNPFPLVHMFVLSFTNVQPEIALQLSSVH